ncbi:tRNA nucleotidyltransferase [Hamiltosporidium tvaerminnensis]|uniref:tRNA nucleotidyltransferase n=2 Tax=Hamiltosporidium TaxID=1176354 RepID=A0A4Q9LCT8_9MICR|nr:tRNA nucleotidyltransferase [Hamiltosporidium magnivora]TBU19525.1 tRNA nucleotidyltransferase [Hamiltosporidium tvaerminnensis]
MKISKKMLTKSEKIIFKKIRKFVTNTGINVIPRVAGGWVRDKLFGNNSNDIDIALDTMSGYEFATKLKDYYSEDPFFSRIGKIKENPEQSKHLETAVMKINCIFVDFVCLRSELYMDSRIPQIKIGTPKDDALRRDLTINSLFYNLMTQEIEDFTEKGIQDLKNKIIRTPLCPLITFRDDPLRILRIMRFAARFNFKIVPEIKIALQNKEIHDALLTKISIERIQIEINKIINFKRSSMVFLWVFKYNLYNSIFKDDTVYDNKKAKLFIKIISQIKSIFVLPVKKIKSTKKNNSYRIQDKDLDLKDVLEHHHPVNCVILNIYKGIFLNIGVIVQSKKPSFKNYLICKENLKFPNKFCDLIQKIEENFLFLEKNIAIFDLTILNCIILIRKMKNSWLETFLLFISIQKLNENVVLEEKAVLFLSFICKNNLCHCYDIIPLVRGKDVGRLTNDKTKYSVLLEKAIEHQILHKSKSKREILEYLRSELNNI